MGNFLLIGRSVESNGSLPKEISVKGKRSGGKRRSAEHLKLKGLLKPGIHPLKKRRKDDYSMGGISLFRRPTKGKRGGHYWKEDPITPERDRRK